MGRRGKHNTAPEWIGEGLHFSCTMCGECCTGPPGYVHFTDEDLRNMCARLGMTEEDFLAKYTRETDKGRSLTEHETAHGFDCVFLDRETVPGKAVCSIHEARPTQCRTFPWWPGNVRSERAWKRLARTCEGVNRVEDGSFVPVEEITRNLGKQVGSRR